MRCVNGKPSNRGDSLQIKEMCESKKFPLEVALDLYCLFEGSDIIRDETIAGLKDDGSMEYWRDKSNFLYSSAVVEKFSESVFVKDLKKKDMSSVAKVRCVVNAVSAAVNAIYSNVTLENTHLGSRIDTQGSVDLSSIDPLVVFNHLDVLATMGSDAANLAASVLPPSPTKGGIEVVVSGTGSFPFYGIVASDKPPVNVSDSDRAAAFLNQHADRFRELVMQAIKTVGKLSKGKSKTQDSLDGKDRKRQMKSIDDIQHASPADVTRDDFDVKVAKKSLVVDKREKKAEDKARLIILLDISSSMQSLVGQVRSFNISRARYAGILVAAMCHNYLKNGEDLVIIPFNDSAPSQFVVDNKKTAADNINAAFRLMCTGGTLFAPPLHNACDLMLRSAKFRECNVLMITDANNFIKSQSDFTTARKRMKKIRRDSKFITFCLHEPDQVDSKLLREQCDVFAVAGWDDKNNCPDFSAIKGVIT